MKTIILTILFSAVVSLLTFVCWYVAQFFVNMFGDRLTASLFMGAFIFGTLFLIAVSLDASKARGKRSRKW